MKILVTGVAGFIGSHIADTYLRMGHEVVGIDNLQTGNLRNIPSQTRFYLCDLNSPRLEYVFKTEKPDLVNHHAAQISVPLSVSKPMYDAQSNALGMLHLLEICRQYQVKKVIFASSGGAIYGEAEQIPTPETCPPNPVSPYSIHKLTGELYLAFYQKQFGLDYTVLRYANVYGPRQLPSSEAGVVSRFINQLLRKEQTFLFTYPDQPEGMIRDYVYVQDLCVANALVLDKGSGEIINIGSGVKTPTLALYHAITELMGVSMQPIVKPPRPGDIRENCLANEKAKVILDWQPQTNLHRGLSATIAYFTERYRKETE